MSLLTKDIITGETVRSDSEISEDGHVVKIVRKGNRSMSILLFLFGLTWLTYLWDDKISPREVWELSILFFAGGTWILFYRISLTLDLLQKSYSAVYGFRLLRGNLSDLIVTATEASFNDSHVAYRVTISQSTGKSLAFLFWFDEYEQCAKRAEELAGEFSIKFRAKR